MMKFKPTEEEWQWFIQEKRDRYCWLLEGVFADQTKYESHKVSLRKMATEDGIL